jgi:hypothetical protein
MTRRHAVATLVAACHLVLVVCGASGLAFSSNPNEDSSARKAVRLYGALSGADNGYGFFAPGVGPQVRATFTLSDDSGRTWTDTLERGMSHEALHRVGGSPALATEPAFRDDLIRSWAGTMFGRHPSACRVVVRLQVYDPPTMEDYRTGERARWETFDAVVCEREE